MRRLLALAAVALLAQPLAASAADAPAPKPLRTLVYEVTYSAHSMHTKRTSGFNGGYGGDPSGAGIGVSAGNGTAGVGIDGDDSGRLSVDVIAATPDGGLVVDVAYAGRTTSQPKVRVALLPDGRMSAAPSQPLSTESLHLLPLLCRGFIANRDVAPGATWDVEQTPPIKGKTTYRVDSLDGNRAKLALEGSMSVSGPNGFDETDRGTTTYATDLVNPVAYDVSLHISKQIGTEETITTTARMTAQLVSDSFAKRS
jgi:hypothetical protein